LEENFEAAKIHLTTEELSEIRKIINSIKIIGTRYDKSYEGKKSQFTYSYVTLFFFRLHELIFSLYKKT
jgi:hypothetical protein